MARILFLAHRIPYPPTKGDKIRSWHFLEHLAAQHEIHLGFYVDDDRDMQHIPFLKEMSASLCYEKVSPFRQKLRGLVNGFLGHLPITLAAYPQRKLRTYARTLLAEGAVDLVFLFSAAVAPLVMKKGRFINDIRVIADLVDMDSAKWAAYATRSRWPLSLLYRREARLLRAFEADVATVAAATVFVTDAEATLFRRETGIVGGVSAVSNGVDLGAFDPERYAEVYPQAAASPVFIFTGAMDYRPNVEAVTWFTRRVWPGVRRALPDARFRIAGAPVASAVAALASEDDGIEVLGFVKDMAGEIAAAGIVVAPLLTARGLQNKVLEGMAMAKPVVATPAALEGIAAVPGRDIIMADGAGDFATALVNLWQTPGKRTEVGGNARRFVEAHHRWEQVVMDIDRLVEKSLEPRA